MRTIKDVLKHKGHAVHSVLPDASVLDALKLMAERNLGAVLVIDPVGRLVGILSERDYARKVVLRGHTSKETPVGSIMTTEVLGIRPDRTVDECLALMSKARVRHLPVMEDDRVIGVVSIGDIVNAVISNQGFVIDQLERYITGSR